MLIAFVLSTIPDGMMVFWESTDIPSGWVVDSSFNERFPRGCPGDSVGQVGGTSTHKHTKITGSVSGASSYKGAKIGPHPVAKAEHTHEIWSSGTIETVNHLPPYRNFLIIKKVEEDAGLPAGVVMMFVSDPPPGWTLILVDSFPRGSLSAWGTGGSLTHYHNFSGIADGPVSPTGALEGNWAANYHTHDVTGYTAEAANLPPYVRVVFAKLEVHAEDVPVWAIAMFDAPPSGSSEIGTWTSFDTLNLGRRFPLGGVPSDALTTGGTSWHKHDIASIQITGFSGHDAPAANGGNVLVAETWHTHTAYPTSTDSALAIPPYRYTTFWQKVDTTVNLTEHEPSDSDTWTAIGLGNAIKIKGPPGLSVRVYDATGKRLFACETEAEELLIRGMKAGVFLVQMEKGGTEVVRKVVI
ncbi:MAG: hypothetical protein ABIM59_07235, partial [candidate division WOR-3 bacterium]